MADTEVIAPPGYQEFGARSSYPGPFACREATMRVLVLDGDERLIAELVQRTLTGPARGAVTYKPLGRRVLLMYGTNKVTSLVKPWSEYGAVMEELAAFWVPVWAGHESDGRLKAKRLCMSAPYILVDNPMSLLTGRETYGFAKGLGCFEHSAGGLAVKGYGGDFGPQAVAGWSQLLEVTPSSAVEDAAEEVELSGIDALVRELAGILIEGYDPASESLDLPGGVRLVADLCKQILSGRSHMVFLKQLRDVADQQRASYQVVVEAPARTRHVRPVISRQDWDVKIHRIDSHPIRRELGIEDQAAKWCAELREYEFDVEAGQVVRP